MNRRDFFLLKTEGSERVLELSCETLYMHYTDIQAASRIGSVEEGSIVGAEWWSGEPPAERLSSSVDQFFDDLEQELIKVDKVRLLDAGWLVAGEFRNRVEAILFTYCERGGELALMDNQNKKTTVSAV